jgi:hypothetical protein
MTEEDKLYKQLYIRFERVIQKNIITKKPGTESSPVPFVYEHTYFLFISQVTNHTIVKTVHAAYS